jgi:hypothetical protein
MEHTVNSGDKIKFIWPDGVGYDIYKVVDNGIILVEVWEPSINGMVKAWCRPEEV